MSDVVTSARTARERLSMGLGALQSPGVPERLLDVAAPVAQAMGALHRIESSGGAALPEAAPAALGFVRSALEQLQSQPMAHPAVDAAVEAVAGSLGLVHGLVQLIQAQPPPGVPPGPVVPMPGEVRAGPIVNREQGTQPSLGVPGMAPQAPAFLSPGAISSPGVAYPQPVVAAPVEFSPSGGGAFGSTLPSSSGPEFLNPGPPAAAYPQPMMAPGMIASAPSSMDKGGFPVVAGMVPVHSPAAPMQAPAMAPMQSPAAPMQAPAMAPPGVPAPVQSSPAAPGATHRVEVSLGVHSPSNFYKGLGGNDVVESGGVFISTYQLLPMGCALALRVCLPGGYEFEAQGVVRWTRDTTLNVGDPPGYGVVFTQISPESRQLVHRYVRNREPLFHDDL
jgi:hypothetical protein